MQQWVPPTPEARAAELLTTERAARRDRWHDNLLAILGFVLSSAAGLALLGVAVHVTDRNMGRIAFWGGLLVGDGGWLVTLYWWYRRAESRGDL